MTPNLISPSLSPSSIVNRVRNVAVNASSITKCGVSLKGLNWRRGSGTRKVYDILRPAYRSECSCQVAMTVFSRILALLYVNVRCITYLVTQFKPVCRRNIICGHRNQYESVGMRY
jgi:hypothetical protein